MIPPTSIDGTDITGATIDGTDVQEITVDGDTVFSAVSLPTGQLARYKFDEGSGTTASDDLGNEGDITLQNGASFISNNDYEGGFGVSFDGTDDVCQMPSPFSFATNPPFSVALTVKFDSIAIDQGIYDFGDISQDFLYAFGTPRSGVGSPSPGDLAGLIKLGGGENRFYIPSPGINTADNFRFVINIKSNNTVDVFMDSNILSVTNGSTELAGSDARDKLGGAAVMQPLDGTIDHLIFYDHTLTQAEVNSDFDAQPYS